MPGVKVRAIVLGFIGFLGLAACHAQDLSKARWLLLGPFSNVDDQGLNKDYLSEVSGEVKAQPHRGEVVGGPAWTERSARNGRIDFLQLYPGSTNTVAYAYTEFNSASEGPAALKLGSDDGIKAWLNGSLVWENHVHRSLQRDEDAIRVTLSKGVNRLLLKVDQGSIAWEFTARLRPVAEEQAEWSVQSSRGLRILVSQQGVPKAADLRCCVTTLPGFAVEEPVQLSVTDVRGKEVGAAHGTTGQWTAVPVPPDAQGAYLLHAKAQGIGAATTAVIIGGKGEIYKEAAAVARAARTTTEQPAATLAFLADELEGKLDPSLSSPERDVRAIQTIQEIVTALKQGPWKPDAFKGQRQWAYRSSIDGSNQPYTVYLPTSYDPARKYPLIVTLHGYTDNDWNAAKNLAVYAPQNYIIAAPYGRGDVGYRVAGEQDVLDVLRMVEGLYSIDVDRVYLAGWSMGGMGTWRVGQLYTDLFAAIAPSCGWGGADYVDNLRNTPVHVVHGDADTLVPVAMSRNMVSKLKGVGATVEYHEIPGAAHDTWSPAVLSRAKINVFDFFDKYTRNPWPAKLSFSVNVVRYGRYFWARVDEISTPLQMAHLDAEVVDTTHVRVQSGKISALALDLRHPGLSQTGEVTVNLDGTDLRVAAGAKEAYFVSEAGAAWHLGSAPNPDLARHTGDAGYATFQGPLTVVYGTLKPERTQLLRRVAETATDWAPNSHLPVGSKIGHYKVISDAEVTQSDLTGGNLLLIGDESENRLTSAQLSFAHIRLRPDSVNVAGQSIRGTGLLATFPNARAPRYLATVITIPQGQRDVEAIVFFSVFSTRAYDVSESATVAPASPDVAVFSDLQAIVGKAPVWTGFYDRNWELVRASPAATVVSPEVNADRTVTLRLRADDATAVTASGDIGDLILTKDAQNVWSATTAPLDPAIYRYFFVVDGAQIADPSNPDIKGTSESLVTVPGNPPKPWEVRNVPHGKVTQISYRSAAFSAQRRYFVYTPPGYETRADKLPALYLLHGYSDDDSSWTAVGKANIIADSLLADGRIKPLIIVMPYGQLNAEVSGSEAFAEDFQQKFQTQLLTEIIPHIEKTYRVLPDARHRAMAGVSMGGMQTAFIGMNHPESFSTIGLWSSAVFGDPAVLLRGLAAAAEKLKHSFRYIHLGVGQQDAFLPRSKAIDEFLTSQKIDHVYAPTPGTHSWLLWRTYLVDFLARFSAIAQ